MWFTYIIALLQSAGRMIGGTTGAIVEEVGNTAALLVNASDEVKNTVTPWIVWANGITDAKRAATPEEVAASAAFRDAVHEQNRLLTAGTPVGDLPPLPSPPAA